MLLESLIVIWENVLYYFVVNLWLWNCVFELNKNFLI